MYSNAMIARLEDFPNAENVARKIEDEILKNPEAGDLIHGTGGLRKLKVADGARNKGKRGGLRVFYFDLTEVARTHLIYLLQKGDAEDISWSEKVALRELIKKIKKEARA